MPFHRIIGLVSAIVVCAAIRMPAQDSAQSVNQAIQHQADAFKKKYPGAKLRFNSQTGLPQLISGIDGLTTASVSKMGTPDRAAIQFFDLKPVRSLFPAALDEKANARVNVVSQESDPDFPGNTIVTLQQQVNNVPVFGAQAKVLITPGLSVASASMDFSPVAKISTTPGINPTVAKQKASESYIALLQSDPSVSESEKAHFGDSPAAGDPKLVVFDPSSLGEHDNVGPHLTWVVKVGSMVFFIDAQNGNVLHKYRNLHSDQSIRAIDYNSHSSNGQLVAVPADGHWNPPEAKAAIENASAVKNYYQSTFQRPLFGVSKCDPDLTDPPSLDLNLRYSGTTASYWDPGLRMPFFADGYANSIDVVGHELTHGVTEFSACMTYDYESGAVNEFLSDFFASMIRQSNGMQPWIIGDNLPDLPHPGAPLRDMCDPHNGGFKRTNVFGPSNRGQPESVSEEVSLSDSICSRDQLNTCAHLNSGILNRAACLAYKAGTTSDKLQHIVYRAIRLIPNQPTLRQAADILKTSCDYEEKAGKFSLEEKDCDNLKSALSTVGLGD